jgi:hypothetical protein
MDTRGVTTGYFDARGKLCGVGDVTRGMRLPRFFFLLLVPVAAACSSTTMGEGDGTTGSNGGSPSSAETRGFDFAIASSGANTQFSELKVATVYGSFCQGQAPNKTCSFTGSLTENGCTAILNVAFVGTPAAGQAFPVVVDATTPPGKGTVNYTEACNDGAMKAWKATAGTIILDAVSPPAAGTATGKVSFSVQRATMSAAPLGAGKAQGTFTVSGSGKDVDAAGM